MSTPSEFTARTTSREVCERFHSSIKGKTILITGASSGSLGHELALSLSQHSPSKLLLANRSTPGETPKATHIPLDLASFASVREAVAQILSVVPSTGIDLLITNAGVMAPPTFRLTPDQHESQFQTNYLGHFLLYNLLQQQMRIGRVVSVVSTGYLTSPVLWSGAPDATSYNPWESYGSSNTAKLLFTLYLARRGVPAYSAHPGIVQTGLQRKADMVGMERAVELIQALHGQEGLAQMAEEVPAKTVGEGAAPILVAALDEQLERGAFVRDCKATKVSAGYAVDEKEAERLWNWSAELVGRSSELRPDVRLEFGV